jgi:hypothetical protein
MGVLVLLPHQRKKQIQHDHRYKQYRPYGIHTAVSRSVFCPQALAAALYRNKQRKKKDNDDDKSYLVLHNVAKVVRI